MISVYQLKPRFQALLQPVVRRLHNWGFTPNSLTIIAFLLSLAMGCYTFYGERQIALLLVPACLLLRMALNALDGMMARQYNLQSKLGAVLNEMGDLLCDAVLYSPVLYVLFGMDPIWVSWFIFLSILNEFAGLLGQALGGERRYDGPMGKSDRALLIGVLCLLIAFGLPSFYILNATVWIVIFGLLIWSTLKRLKHAL